MIPVNLSHYPISIQNNLLPKVQIISNIIGDYIDAQFISEDTNGTSCNTFKVIDCLSLIELYKLFYNDIILLSKEIDSSVLVNKYNICSIIDCFINKYPHKDNYKLKEIIIGYDVNNNPISISICSNYKIKYINDEILITNNEILYTTSMLYYNINISTPLNTVDISNMILLSNDIQIGNIFNVTIPTGTTSIVFAIPTTLDNITINDLDDINYNIVSTFIKTNAIFTINNISIPYTVYRYESVPTASIIYLKITI